MRNRRFVLPAAFTALMLCSAILALPAEGAGYSHNPIAPLQATADATQDPCNPEPAVPGTVLTTMFLLDQPNQAGLPLLKVFNTDIVNVLGKTSSGFWVAVQSNTGIVGWLPSPQVQINKKLFGDVKLVPIITELPAVEPEEVATDESGAIVTEEAPDCPAIDAIITADKFVLQVKPLTRSGDAGKTVIKGEKVTILALNPAGSWALVRAETGEEGWITTSYTSVVGGTAKLSRVRKDYTVVEATLTPQP
jgi:hypothetical protein